MGAIVAWSACPRTASHCTRAATSPIVGIGASGPAELVTVERWRLGDVELAGGLAVSLELPAVSRLFGFQGLVGSDLLGRFRAVTIDYGRGQLVLR